MDGGSVIFKFKGDSSQLEKTATSVGDIIKGSLAAKGIAKALEVINDNMGDAIKRVDQLNQFPKVMQALGISSEDSSEAMELINNKILGLPTTLNQATTAVQRFVAKNGDVKTSAKYFTAINDALLSGTNDTTLYSNALEQVMQAYSKGKPDMMEWRSMLTAMPAQLKQISQAFGYVDTDDLYEALKHGEVSMDDFLAMVVKLDNEGSNGMASFSDSVKDSVGGIGTSITNMNTAIVRGISNTFGALDESLSASGLPTIVDMIKNITSGIDTAFQGFNASLKNMDMKSIVSALKTSVPLLLMIPKNSSQFEFFGGILDSLGGSTSSFLKKWEKSGGLIKMVSDNFSDFEKKASTSISKTMPMLNKILVSPKDLATKLLNVIKSMFPSISTLAESTLGKISKLNINSKLNALVENIGGFTSKIAGSLSSFAPIFIKGLGIAAIVGAVMTGIGALDSVFGDSITQLLNKAITDGPLLISNFITGVVTKIPDLIAKATELIALFGQTLIANLPAIIQGGVQLLSSLIVGIANSLPTLIPMVIQVIITLVTALIENLPTIITAGIQLLLGLIRGIVAALPILIENIPKIISTLVTTLLDPNMLSMIISAGIELIISLAGALISAIPLLVRSIPRVISAIFRALIELGSNTDWGQIGHNILNGLINGLLNFGSIIKNAISRLGNAIVNGVKDFFGIHSPSKVMFKIGGYIDQGLINGVESLKDEAQTSVTGLVNPNSLIDMSPSLFGSASTNLSPIINVTNDINVETDPLGQVVQNVKTFSGGAKNDYNYGMGV